MVFTTVFFAGTDFFGGTIFLLGFEVLIWNASTDLEPCKIVAKITKDTPIAICNIY